MLIYLYYKQFQTKMAVAEKKRIGTSTLNGFSKYSHSYKMAIRMSNVCVVLDL